MFPKSSRLASIFAMIALVSLGGDQPSAESQPPNLETLATQVDVIVRQAMERQRIPGLSLAVIRDGQLVLTKGYGLANVELQVPAAPETVYQIQSITKSFTATGIMLLVDEGKMGLDDKVSASLDGVPETWKEITVRHLLTHTSGIKDFLNEPTIDLRLEATENEVFKTTVTRPLNFPPGERYGYSNTNYLLLGMIIRKMTGKSWGDYLRERIFDPLGMENTRVLSLSDIISHRAAGYRMDAISAGGVRNGDFVPASLLATAGGGLRSTVLDMVQWAAAIDAERVLKKSSWEQMWTPAKLNNGNASTYGLGWSVQMVHGHRYVSHNGANVTGFSTTFHHFPNHRLSVVLFANNGDVVLPRLGLQVAGVFVPDLAPPIRQPMEDKEPRIAARFQTIYANWAKGELDEKQYTEQQAKSLRQEELQKLTQSWGPLQSIALVERSMEGEQRQYHYLAVFQGLDVLVTITIDKHDLISGLRLVPE